MPATSPDPIVVLGDTRSFRAKKEGGGGHPQNYDPHTGQWLGAGGTDLPAQLKAKGGFTLDARTGTLVKQGIAVAIEGHTEIMSAAEFAGDKGRQFVRDYVRKMARSDPPAGAMVGGWHDSEHDEIVLDWVEVFNDRAAGIRAGRQRDQMAVYDLSTEEEIPTGGTGGREEILEAQTAGSRQAGQAVVGDDRRGARPSGRWAPRGDGRQAGARPEEGLRAKSGLKEGGGGRPQAYGEHGKYTKRISPVSGKTVKATVAVDLTMSVLPEAVQAKSIAQMEQSLGVDFETAVGHLVTMAEAGYAKGLPGKDWYDEARAAALESAERHGVDPDVAVGVVAALSPGTKWEENLRNADAMMSMRAQWDEPLDPAHLEATNAWGAKIDGTTKAPNSTVQAVAGETLGELYKKDPHLAGVYSAKKIGASVGYSYDNFFKSLDLVAVNDPATIDGTLNGAKVRSFFNNILDPTSSAGDVTIDVHMQRAMANDLDATTPLQKHERMTSIAKRSSSITGSPSYAGASLGAMPVMADVTREATRRFNQRNSVNLRPLQFQAVVWTEQINSFPPSTVEEILRAPVEVEVPA